MPEPERRDRLKEVEAIHRRILARLDASDKRAAEREKRWRERREKHRAELRVMGFREVSSKQMLAAVKRLSDRVDRFVESLEAKRKTRSRRSK
jgi:hypothetical protein